ncbi:hypothetical protein QE152_g13268 [Popillia japonica]|uniref:Uncharacterized protein n=1 Tax=Popillia japonica TaxID=7064 RepID=A0AAW1LFM7_POPJA
MTLNPNSMDGRIVERQKVIAICDRCTSTGGEDKERRLAPLELPLQVIAICDRCTSTGGEDKERRLAPLELPLQMGAAKLNL